MDRQDAHSDSTSVALTLLDTLRDRAGNYADIPSDTGLTPQHNSLAHIIKLYAERLPMFRAPETAVGLVRAGKVVWLRCPYVSFGRVTRWGNLLLHLRVGCLAAIWKICRLSAAPRPWSRRASQCHRSHRPRRSPVRLVQLEFWNPKSKRKTKERLARQCQTDHPVHQDPAPKRRRYYPHPMHQNRAPKRQKHYPRSVHQRPKNHPVQNRALKRQRYQKDHSVHQDRAPKRQNDRSASPSPNYAT